MERNHEWVQIGDAHHVEKMIILWFSSSQSVIRATQMSGTYNTLKIYDLMSHLPICFVDVLAGIKGNKHEGVCSILIDIKIVTIVEITWVQ